MPLAGTDDGEKYQVADDAGNSRIPTEAIIPIFEISGGTAGRARIIGTGFFIGPSLLVTARHVLEECYNRDEEGNFLTQKSTPWVMVNHQPGKWLWRPLLSSSCAKDYDTAVAQVAPIPEFRNLSLPIRGGKANASEIAFTYAYPNSVVLEKDDGDQEIVLNPAFYRGKVIEYYPEQRDRLMNWPCYHVDFHMHAGASGGPVFDRHGRVFGINCRSFQPETDVSFVTDIENIKDAQVLGIQIDGKYHERITVREMILQGAISLH